MTTAPELFLRPFKEATESGTPVVAMDAAAPEGSGVTTFVGNSNVTVGETLAKAMLEKLPESGEVVIGNDTPGLPLQEERVEGMENVLKKERPGLKISGPFNVGSEPAENYDHWNNLLKAHPDAAAYMAPGDQDAVSFERIEKTGGKKFLAGACDVDPIALEAVKEGYVYALGDPWHFLKGYISASLLARQAKAGKPMPEGWWNPGQGLVTAANVDEVMKRESSVKNRDAYFEPIAEKELKDPSKYLKPLSALGS
jgi:ribose transport system substrate-binding protein